MSLVKDYELEIPERPYRLFWHNRFLRSFDNKNDLKNCFLFFKRFLVNIKCKKIR